MIRKTIAKHNEGARIYMHLLTAVGPCWLVHFYITLFQITVSTVSVLANSPTNISSLFYNTKFTILTHQE